MAKTTISVAFFIAIGQLAVPSSAQTARRPPQPAPQASVPVAATPAVAPQATPTAPGNPTAATQSPPVNGAPVAPAASAAPAAAAPASAAAAPAAAFPAPAGGTQVAESPLPAAPMFQRPEPLGGTLAPEAGTPPQPNEPPPPPRTYEHRFSVTVDLANVIWRSSRGYDLFSSNDAAWRLGVGFGYDAFKLPNQLILAVEGGALLEPGQSGNTDSGLLGGSLRGSLSAATFLVGGSLRWAATSWLAPYGRLQLFTSRYAVDIQTAAGNVTTGASGGEWSYHRWAEGGALGAGVMANLPPRSPVNVGILVEGGYWLQQSVDLVLEGNPPAGGIATTGAHIGSLGNSGPYLRLAGVLRF